MAEIPIFKRDLEMYVLGKTAQEKLSKGEDIIIEEGDGKDPLKILFNKELMSYQHRSDVGLQRMAEIPIFKGSDSIFLSTIFVFLFTFIYFIIASHLFKDWLEL
jgi:hypothetical protein